MAKCQQRVTLGVGIFIVVFVTFLQASNNTKLEIKKQILRARCNSLAAKSLPCI